MSKRAKLDQKRDEHEHNRQRERKRQFAKARLLFFIDATVFDSHPWGKLHLLCQKTLNFRDPSAEVFPFEPSRNRHRLSQPVASNFRLTCVVGNVRDLIETEERS